MFLNSTNLWQGWADDEYWDISIQTWTSWSSFCTGFWSSQKSWFDWTSPNILDVDTLTWVPSCNSSQIEITDPALFNVDSIWRTLEYYIDPSSDNLLEFGTKQHPYRTSKPVFAEILKHHSHTNREIMVYLKEGTNTYIEDSSIFVINMESITVSSYSDVGSSSDSATITTTDLPVNGISSKAMFHLVKDVTLDVNSIIAAGAFTPYELSTLGRTGDAFQIVRSSFYMSNVVAKRQASNPFIGVFIYLLNLQNKIFDLSKFRPSILFTF